MMLTLPLLVPLTCTVSVNDCADATAGMRADAATKRIVRIRDWPMFPPDRMIGKRRTGGNRQERALARGRQGLGVRAVARCFHQTLVPARDNPVNRPASHR